MVKRILILLPVILCVACINHTSQEDGDVISSQRDSIEIRYAKGFEVTYKNEFTRIITKSLPENTFFRDSVLIIHDPQFKIGKDTKILPEKLSSVCCQSSTHLAFIDYLEQIQTVTGVCGMQYVKNKRIRKILRDNGVKEICMGESTQMELLLERNPELYLVYPFGSQQNERINQNGVQTFMIAEYLERDPLARLEWIKLFGLIFNKVPEAEQYFSSVENQYLGLVQTAPDTNKKFIFNVPFGDSWHMPSSNSLIVKLLEDAGMYYYYRNQSGTENSLYSKEEVWEVGAVASYWIIIADRKEDFSLTDLIEEDEVYTSFKSVRNHQVIFCNTATSGYFTEGVIEPHIMIKDILYATHKIDQHQPKYFHLLK